MCVRVCEPGFSTVQVLYMSTDGCRNQPRPLSLFFCSQSRGARRNWKRPRAKVTLFNVVPPKKYLSLACFSLFSFMKRWTGGERVFLFSGCSLGKCLPPCAPSSHTCRHTANLIDVFGYLGGYFPFFSDF